MHSMTGMGKANGQVLNIPVQIEIKAVNHRFCDISLRSPSKYGTLEIQIQKLVKSMLTRGRIEIYINEEKTTDLSNVEESAVKSYFSYLSNVKDLLQLDEKPALGLVMAGIHSWVQKAFDSEAAWQDLEGILRAALKDLIKMRESEGLRLKQDLSERVRVIDGIRQKISGRLRDIKQDLEAKFKQKLQDKLAEIKELDAQRLATEVIFYLDRMDITEELERIQSHLTQMKQFMDKESGVGRKIDFLLQEFNREFNTITSKCSHPEVSYLVVDAKAELEKMREQIQNIE